MHDTSALDLAPIMEASGTVIVTTDLEGLVATWNSAAQQLFGSSHEEAVGRPGSRNQQPWHGNISALCPDDGVIDLAVSLGSVTGRCEQVGLGFVGGVATQGRDPAVSDDRNWQLAESQRLAQLGSWSWDIRTDTVEWSDETFRIFGLVPGELEPSAAEFLQRVHPEERATLEEDIRSLLDQDESRSRDFRIVRVDRSVRWVHGRAFLERDAVRAPLRMAGTIQDVTDAVAVANDLAAARDAALAASRAKSEFVAMMSHEIRVLANEGWRPVGLTA